MSAGTSGPGAVIRGLLLDFGSVISVSVFERHRQTEQLLGLPTSDLPALDFLVDARILVIQPGVHLGAARVVFLPLGFGQSTGSRPGDENTGRGDRGDLADV